VPASEGKAGGPETVPAPAPAPPAVVKGPPARKVKVTRPSPELRADQAREVLERVKSGFPGEVTDEGSRPGILARLSIPPGAVVRVCTWLRDEGSFGHCALVGAVDWRETREVVYILWSDQLQTYLELTTRVPGEDPHLESVSGVWFGANWHEREAWDLVGIRFDHHPDLRRLFLPEGYQFHPLLKTFELHEPEELEVKARLGR
jgi:NADH-quinone oxidoreductase subunit C